MGLFVDGVGVCGGSLLSRGWLVKRDHIESNIGVGRVCGGRHMAWVAGEERQPTAWFVLIMLTPKFLFMTPNIRAIYHAAPFLKIHIYRRETTVRSLQRINAGFCVLACRHAARACTYTYPLLFLHCRYATTATSMSK